MLALVVAAVLGLTLLAWSNRFVQDDAFISFRYARNLVEGHGLVWNPGERVEGYTNFLWTVAMAVPLRFGWDPVQFSFVLGMALFALTLVLTYRLVSLLVGSSVAGLLAVILLGANYTFSCYATGGMETQLQAALFTGCVLLQVHMLRSGTAGPASVILLSLLLAVAILTRPDSVLLAGPVVATALALLLPRQRGFAAKAGLVAALCAPLVVVLGCWLGWKLSFYGRLLPNSFYVKATSFNVGRGLFYLFLFLFSYWLMPFVLLGAAHLPALLRERSPGWTVALAVVAFWTAYAVAVGGDFMEFRFFVPILPLLFALVARSVSRPSLDLRLRVVLSTLVLLGSLSHALTFGRLVDTEGEVESVSELAAHLTDRRWNWVRIGRELGAAFPAGSDVTIATTAAGAIPFYSGLETVDMLGVNDAWIPWFGESYASKKPGHRRWATLGYLLERDVNIVIGHPWMLCDIDFSRVSFSLQDVNEFVTVADPVELPQGARMLGIPVEGGGTLVTFYLVRNPVVDSVIESRGWSTFPRD